ncbi:hypothetical protein M409DRAFT_20685 [Zasmidium cellare ATCC 36951]|uniref:Uncharacterized protein n=1 Tax=Zasmidium cellare ATCC 36951 TaxID=1080233 RepID=A0A6A6CUJ1_ZASCE|nr:uncharacterized protein M409DRAFT_20685 [Zasmidium cellare ATCC 36951]KAF2169469.1 hypothetical protein M409DRAFT_20685 [Zasmidium cellare ATCC 36951]
MTYSPVQSEIEYFVKTFDHNLVNSPVEFQDPDTVDHAWASLYDAGATALSIDEAHRIPNATISSDHGGSKEYLVQLGVFHQLHCLDVMRQALEPLYGLKNDSLARLQANGGTRQRKQLPKRQRESKPSRESQHDPRPWKLIGNVKHLNHCLNALRQAIMCHSDVSVLVWQWFDPVEEYAPDPFDELRPFNVPYTNVPHTCRNFDKISEWAKARRPATLPDFTQRPQGSDLNIESWP